MHIEQSCCKIIELNPFYHKTGACLFDWEKDKDVLLSGDCVIRLASESHAAKCAQAEFQGIKQEIEEAASKSTQREPKCSIC